MKITPSRLIAWNKMLYGLSGASFVAMLFVFQDGDFILNPTKVAGLFFIASCFLLAACLISEMAISRGLISIPAFLVHQVLTAIGVVCAVGGFYQVLWFFNKNLGWLLIAVFLILMPVCFFAIESIHKAYLQQEKTCERDQKKQTDDK